MRPQPTITEICLNNVVACLQALLPVMVEINDTFGPPFVQAIVNTTISLIAAIPNIKKSKSECLQLVENIHGIVATIVSLFIKSETTGVLPPGIMYHIGEFTETIHKIHAFVEAHQEGNRIKQFFRQSEMNLLFKRCRNGLQHAMDVFNVENQGSLLTDVGEIQRHATRTHQQLLELVSTVSESASTAETSSIAIYPMPSSLQNSSDSFSMLPAKPKIFHGREFELELIVTALKNEGARIAILGTGGIGKTSLARAVLHHPVVLDKYEHRFFVAVDSATTTAEFAAQIGRHLGLKAGKDLSKAIIRHLSERSPCLLVLDNLDTPWEPLESRTGVEQFLAQLTELPGLALLITMRGAERPAKVLWTRPFLAPLEPLASDAARQTFADIAEDFHDPEDVDKILQLTDNMPLAVDLIAHLVDHEGCSSVLTRWEKEKTVALSHGYDRRSNLDASITISLSSPRFKSTPGAEQFPNFPLPIF
ncbi:P-loop containing nucleoside triphosphate hydrolase protein [Mycena crocata]|nr:P-loop containing nucleoside triphosphate hydrolase protein [Mycena crocata]